MLLKFFAPCFRFNTSMLILIYQDFEIWFADMCFNTSMLILIMDARTNQIGIMEFQYIHVNINQVKGNWKLKMHIWFQYIHVNINRFLASLQA